MNQHSFRALIREQNSQKLPVLWIQLRRGPYWPVQADRPVAEVHIDELITHWPESVTDRLNRILRWLARDTHSAGFSCHIGELSAGNSAGLARFFASTDRDAQYHLRALVERGWVIEDPNDQSVEITPSGWMRIEEIERGHPSPNNPAFVAMWFGNNDSDETQDFMRALYEERIKPAIERAGYKADRVDLVEHNDFIMDKVLGMIRVAPFVVADFTGNRGGVYLEAGFARGLGIPVIHTCRESDFEKAHFDIKQINTIRWDKPEDLGETIYHRIAGSIGLGPFLPDR